MDFYQKPNSATNARNTTTAKMVRCIQAVRKPVKKEEESVDMFLHSVVKKNSDQLLKMQNFKDEIDANNAQEEQ